VGWGC